MDSANVRVFGGEVIKYLRRTVVAAIVDENNFVIQPVVGKFRTLGGKTGIGLREHILLVVRGQDDAEQRTGGVPGLAVGTGIGGSGEHSNFTGKRPPIWWGRHPVCHGRMYSSV